MTRKDIKDKNNLIIGYLNEYDNNITAIHIRKGYAGYYNKVSDITFDAAGKLYCYGDGTSDLIREVDRN